MLTLTWILLLFVMVYPQRMVAPVDLSSRLLQAAMFAASMLAWASVFARWRAMTRPHGRAVVDRVIPIGVVVLVIGAGVMEYVQAFEATRISSIYDFMINATTVIVVGCIFILLDVRIEIHDSNENIF